MQWPGGQDQLSAGQAGVYPAPPVSARGEELPAAAEPSAEPAAEPSGEAVVEPADTDGSTWRKLAKRGAYAEAFRAIAPGGSKKVEDNPADLMLAADVARLSRHPAEATRFLSRVADGFPRDQRAPLAAFTLGRVLLEDLGQPARAADAFRRAQQLAPRGPLASDALAREALAAQRSGQAERSRLLARRYLELFPKGSQAERLRKL